MKYNRRKFLASSAIGAIGATMGLKAQNSKKNPSLVFNPVLPSLAFAEVRLGDT